MNRRQGHTLIETLIASALISICLLGVWRLVQAGSRYLLITDAKVEMQNGALRCLRMIAEQFCETNERAFTVGNSTASPSYASQTNQGVIFNSPRDPGTGEIEHDAMGRIRWAKYVAFYKYEQLPGQFVVARSSANCDPVLPYPRFPPLLDAFLATNPSPRIVARHVAIFECVKFPGNVQVRLRCELPSGFGRKYGFEAETMVFARN